MSRLISGNADGISRAPNPMQMKLYIPRTKEDPLVDRDNASSKGAEDHELTGPRSTGEFEICNGKNVAQRFLFNRHNPSSVLQALE